jgi:two-component system, cell cycle sensor histidine kinase and response regulator CckA
MEAIGTLAGGIAHDFNNMLFPIMGNAEMALDDLPEDSPVRSNLGEILRGARRSRDLVKQILTLCRQSDQGLKPLNVQYVVKEVLKLVKSSLPATIEICENIDKNCGFVQADVTQINQIVMNLVTNACHAMEETGGRLEVSLQNESGDWG